MALTQKQKNARYYATTRGRAVTLVNNAKQNKRGHGFDLDVAFVESRILDGRCEVSSLPFCLKTSGEGTRHNPWSPSLDRIDSTKGYTRGNVRVVVWMYNAMKAQYSDEDCAVLAHAIINNRENRNGLT